MTIFCSEHLRALRGSTWEWLRDFGDGPDRVFARRYASKVDAEMKKTKKSEGGLML